ncbi:MULTISPECIES: ABC transporter substrate-binding protein [Psychrilyobacter]|uniref:ABC transporter substrate-binding protein n=1 Tax=Psychrilyobacter piezotolerans TaxID=2293438 RepID=A0ABX9KF20_9FUSO|nr:MULTISPECIES: ABC transporter substrate-binding protein [Psychrilyobacter]MCS5421289.1 ABC transporter substrate-binding protein [Psychrilyobacter sp. S5]NDI78152.1 ABC transporter substrate-binding protein [Psychrilyobacter piezotolerans]RDE60156.1 ABC transporter substrate-binding protein [Psychrilyobacter sp. S5]REI40338.1 ABC transporter substrate-binding protein [Psychrilyobacter piezotolerans]
MKKLILGIILIMVLAGCQEKKKDGVTEKINIGITQIVEHPSLDLIRKGVEDALKDSEYKDKIIFSYQNAQGDFITAQTIAAQFNENSDIIVAITTPSAQAALNKIPEKPLFFTAVTNPVIAGLEGKNITGVSDMSPVKDQVKLIQEFLPKTKTIGTIYTTSEANSTYLVEEFTKAAEKAGYKVIARGVTNVIEIASAMDSLMGAVDVIYTAKDNNIASAYSLIIDRANKADIPVIGATKDFTEAGALASSGISEYQVGYQTGEMILRHLSGEKIKDLPIEYLKKSELTINEKQMKKYGISLDSDQLKNIEIIKE